MGVGHFVEHLNSIGDKLRLGQMEDNDGQKVKGQEVVGGSRGGPPKLNNEDKGRLHYKT